jgi:two-component system LytT family response regulator
MKIRAIIVDDETLSREMLATMLECVEPKVEVIASCANLMQAVIEINKLKPDLVFLDIDMPQYKGIEIVHFFEEIDFDIIFTTAHAQYALDAIKMQAFGAYTKIVHQDPMITSSKNLKYYEAKLTSNPQFVRCHKSYIVNRKQIIHINKFRQEILMNNRDTIALALDKLDHVLLE